MQVTTRFAAIALWACFSDALPLYAAGSPSAKLEGYRCEVLRDSEAPSGAPVGSILVCQIVDDGGPIQARSQARGVLVRSGSTLDSLLDNARHDASLQRHGAVVPAPAP